jgi:dTDP-glucose 4,6-dehydratase
MAKKVLVTGGVGFVGHHAVEHLLKNTNWHVIIVDSLNYAGNLNRLTDTDIWEKEKDRVEFVWHDLRAPISETTHKMIGDLDYIWHLAAESHVERSLEDSVPFVTSNVLGTTNLLEYIKKEQPNLKKYIQFSTDEVYGPAPEGVFYKEWDRLKPSNPYAATKGGGDLLAFAFSHSFRLPILVTRSMNIFGERQHPEKFIPRTVRAMLNNETIVIHGVPGNISSRCWIHARSVADATIFLLKNGEPGEIYNIAGEERSVLDLANRISELIRGRKLSEEETEYVDFHRTRPGHDRRYALDGTKLREMGWASKLTLDQSFDKMIHWMVKHPEWLNL